MSVAPTLDLIGVGSPIMDLLAPVPETFVAGISGAKGGMVLVDEAEMAALLSKLPAEPARATGGSSANTTFNGARLGLTTAFLGKLGRDALADVYRDRFAGAGVDTSRFKSGDHPTARCLALVTPDAQRTLRTSLGAAMTLAPDEIGPDDFRGARHVHVEGYLAFNPALCAKVLDSAQAAGCTVSLDLASFEMVRIGREWLLGRFARGIDVVFANEDEIRALYPDGDDDFAAMALRLAATGVTAAVKMGADGAFIAQGRQLHRIEPVAVADLVDTNGAGDAWAAGFLFGKLRGLSLPACGAIASRLGAETVRHLGPLVPDPAWPEARSRVLAGV